MLRWQVNPKSFTAFDFSLNGHYGYAFHFTEYTFYKYGVTLSKDVNGIEPYVSGYLYKFGVYEEDDIVNDFKESYDHNHGLAFGIAFPFKKAKIYPEINYQFFRNHIGKGNIVFGIGLRSEN